jgi:hypothetical protein
MEPVWSVPGNPMRNTRGFRAGFGRRGASAPPNRALWERVVLVSDSGISFVPFALDPLQLHRNLLGSKNPPDLGDESRQLLREGAMLGRGFGKIQQFLFDEIIEGRFKSVTISDRASCLALLNPDFVQLAGVHHAIAP